MKKLGILFATVVMIVLFTMSSSALETTGQCGDNVYWSFDESTGELVISGEGEMWNYNLDYLPSFRHWKNVIKNVVIMNGVTTIGDYVFTSCDMESITISDTVRTIGDGSFGGCSIIEIFIPSSVVEISDTAFRDTFSLTNIVVDIDNLVYSSDDQGVLFDKNKTIIIKYPSNNRGISYAIPEGVKTIGFQAFARSGYLKSVIMPNSVTDINDGAFSECGITNLIIPYGVINIGKSAFYECQGLISAIIPDSVKTIDERAFWCCSDLTNVVLSNSIEVISDCAFGWCFSLSSITIPDSVQTIGDGAFSECAALKNISFGKNVSKIGDYAFSATNFENIILPDTIKTIGSGAFSWCKRLKSVKIPDSVESIGESAFLGQDTPNSITVDENNAFYSSDKYGVLFNKDKSILIKYPSGSTNESYIIPDSVNTICKEAFWECSSIVSVVIPNSVTEIGRQAFGTPNLKNVYYKGSEINWNKIEIDEMKESLSTATIHYNYKEEPPHTHSYTSTVTKEATCWREGEKTYTCTCGESYTEAIAKLDHEYRPWETKKNPTCTAPGLEWSYCLICDNDFEREIPATGHTIIDYTRRATPDSDGAYVTACDVCNEVFKSISFGRPTEYKLSTTKYTYDGKTKTPKLTVETSDGVVLKEGVDYELELPSGRKAVGVYTYRVVFRGNFLGEKKVSYQILPGKTSKITATQSTSAIKLTWKKVTGADGYRVYQYNSKTGKYEKIKTLTGTSYTVKKLKAGTTYKFAVKAYSKADGETLWAASYKTFATCTKPATPTVKATAGSKQATISWNKVTGATGYVVYMQDDFGDYEKLGSTKKTSYIRKKLTKGKTYYFRVRAYKTVDGKNIYGGYKTVKVKVK